MPTPLERFQSLLRELFQFEQADLDFGVYRIMNLRRERMDRWLNEELPARARAILRQGGNTADDDLGGRLDVLKAALLELEPGGVDEDGNITRDFLKESTKGKDYLRLKAQHDRAPARTAAGMEPLVYNHLYDFFSRYYDTGDFIPKRRRSFAPDGRDTYAIPWDGEEVVLHWANKDQYYIKTGERFTHYRWQSAAGGRTFTVEFRLTDADLPANNNKDAKKKFNLLVADNVEWQEAKATLILPFHYRGLTPEEEAQLIGTQEAKLRESIIKRTVDTLRELPAVSGVSQLVTALMAPKRDAAGQEKRDKDGNAVPLLPHHLNRWAVKNESDFFIHKDLRRFLSGELDYFLKSVVLNLDNLLAAGEQRAEPNFRLLDAVKRLGTEIVDFVSQLEDFQKALFEKKKFVLETSWCLTLDRIPASVKEEVYTAILANDRQWEEWETLYKISTLNHEADSPANQETESFILRETPPETSARAATYSRQKQNVVYSSEANKSPSPFRGFAPSREFLEAHPYLMLDTALDYPPAVVEKLLCNIENLDEQMDGLLVHSENLQALTLLQERYREAVKCVYIDPPYNTGGDGFNYRDGYQHSSWISAMSQSTALCSNLLLSHGAFFASIDDNEVENLKRVLHDQIRPSEFLAHIVWQKRYAPDVRTAISDAHEHILVFTKDSEAFKATRKKLPITDKQRDQFSNPDDDPRGPWKSDNFTAQGFRPNQMYAIQLPSGRTVTPPHGRCWVTTEDKFKELLAADRMYFGRGGDGLPAAKRFLAEMDGMVPWTWWEHSEVGHSQQGMKVTMDLFGREGAFLTAKPVKLVERALLITNTDKETTLDYFAGSGTTGHATISLNRQDSGARKYVLIEMGAHFDSVLKPRLQKVIFSESWKEGMPDCQAKPLMTKNRYNGISHCIKVLRLESYEDALDNIEFNTAAAPGIELGLEFKRDYELRYALDWESKDCPTRLAVEQLDTPFDYTLTLRRETGTVTVKPDLPETFAYLIGLHTRRRFRTEREGVSYLIYTGTLHADGTEVAVLWRTCRGWTEANLKAEMDWWRGQRETLAPGATRVYVNGASAIEGHHSLDAEFKNRMHS